MADEAHAAGRESSHVDQRRLRCVLGDEQIAQTTTDRHRRAVALRDGVPIGVAAFELLYGPRAEFTLTLADPAETPVIEALIDAMVQRANESGVHVLQARLAPEQLDLAETIRNARIGADAVSIDVREYESVQNTQPTGDATRMAEGGRGFTITA